MNLHLDDNSKPLDDALDQQDLARFGYRQELRRSLGGFSSFAAGFSYISILTGMFQTFHLGYGRGGPAFFWTWPVVFVGQLLVALCFAELAAHYPVSGSVYQWSKQIGHRAVGWLAGWIFLACLIVTLAAVALALQVTLPQIHAGFQLIGDGRTASDRAANAVLLGCLLIALSTVVNSAGVRLMAWLNNLGVFTEIAALFGLVILLSLRARRGPEILMDTQGKGAELGGYAGLFAAAMTLTASYVLYGFDTAGTLAEETHEPRRKAPRAILGALCTAALGGALLLLTAIMSARDTADPRLGHEDGGLPFIVKQTLGEALGTMFLLAVIFAVVVCAITVQTSVVRLMFAMARDNKLPFSRTLARVSARTHTPPVPNLLVGALAAGILLVNVNYPRVIESVTGMAALWANLAYLLLTIFLLAKRLRGWPSRADEAGLFSLGRCGLPVNLLAVLWGLFIVSNIAWPRLDAEHPDLFSSYAPLACTAVLVGIGVTYYSLVQRHKPSGQEIDLNPGS